MGILLCLNFLYAQSGWALFLWVFYALVHTCRPWKSALDPRVAPVKLCSHRYVTHLCPSPTCEHYRGAP